MAHIDKEIPLHSVRSLSQNISKEKIRQKLELESKSKIRIVPFRI